MKNSERRKSQVLPVGPRAPRETRGQAAAGRNRRCRRAAKCGRVCAPSSCITAAAGLTIHAGLAGRGRGVCRHPLTNPRPQQHVALQLFMPCSGALVSKLRTQRRARGPAVATSLGQARPPAASAGTAGGWLRGACALWRAPAVRSRHRHARGQRCAGITVTMPCFASASHSAC